MKKNSKITSKDTSSSKHPSPAVTNYPSPLNQRALEISNEKKIHQITEKFREILEILGLDLNDESLAKTPERVAKMYVNEIFSGLNSNSFPKISFIEDKFQHNSHSNMVFMKVHFISFCEHHFVPIAGYAYVAYVPNGKLIGLSKIPRIVRFFAKRPQVQERLTAQIADSLSILLDTEDVGVSIIAEHYCVIARGIEDENGHTITNVLRGRIEKDETLRREFFEAVNRKLCS